MILIISGTNRPNSNSLRIAKHYKELLLKKYDQKVALVDLAEIQENMLNDEMYDADKQGSALKKAQDELFIPAKKWIIVSPEYNGTYPGIVKLLLDALSVRKADLTFLEKKVALVGVSSGRAGNWLGMNHLTAVLNYLKMHVFYNKFAIRNISSLLDDEKHISDEKTISSIEEQVDAFLKF